MASIVRSGKRTRAAGSASGQRRSDEERLISKSRGLIAEAHRLAKAHNGRDRADAADAKDFRRRALLLGQEFLDLIGELQVTAAEIDRRINARMSQAVAIDAYTSCRRIGQQYARDVRRRK